MSLKEYSAGAVKHSFWFMEFRKVIQLLSKGMTLEKIKSINKTENIFGVGSPARAEQIFNTVSARIRCLDSSIYSVFMNSDISTQKMIALVAAMANDRLFFEFVYEVVREKLIVGSNELSDSDINIFFRDKQMQSEKVAGWKDYTLKRLGATYKTMLFEAGLVDKGKSIRKIYKPILGIEFERWLEANNMKIMIKTLTGVR